MQKIRKNRSDKKGGIIYSSDSQLSEETKQQLLNNDIKNMQRIERANLMNKLEMNLKNMQGAALSHEEQVKNQIIENNSVYPFGGNSRTVKKHADLVYYNITIPHNDAQGLGPNPAVFQEVRSLPLFEGSPSDYDMSIIRFSIPSNFIPILLFPIQPYPNTNPNLSTMSVTLSYNGVDEQTYLIYTPENLYIPVPPPPASNEGSIRYLYSTYYSIFSYQIMLDMINTALETSYNNLLATFGGSPPANFPTTPPFMALNSATGIFTLYAQTLYNSRQTPPYCQIYFNGILNTLFDGAFNTLFYQYNSPNGKDVLYLIENEGTNLVQVIPPSFSQIPISWNRTTAYVIGNIVNWSNVYWIATVNNTGSEPTASNVNWNVYEGFYSYASNAEFNCQPLWFTIENIIITSGSLPIRYEWLSSQKQLISGTESTNENFFRIVTDFNIDITEGSETRTFINYLPTAEYRRIDLIGNTPIYNIDIQLYWKDFYDNIYPIVIPIHSQVTIKVLFERKYKHVEFK
jgi:hypothetical protein